MKAKLWAVSTLVWLLSGCGEKDHLIKPALEGEQATIEIVDSNWDKLIAKCPGLNKYSADLTYDGLTDMTYLDTPMSRVEIKFKVAKEPSVVPNSFKAWGHTCAFGISPDGKNLRIPKDLCVSVCQGKEYQPTGKNYVTSL
ncbi:hypothetical protein NMS86_001247 [Vibrio cholerae]|nr:hypothetical protein [Vibrio cholerae]